MTRKSKQPKSRKLGNKSDDKILRASDASAKRIVELFVEIVNNRSKEAGGVAMGADYMTRVDGYPSKNQVKSGMAYFSNTGPFGTYCGKCAFYEPHGRAGYCKKYLEMAKAWGAQVRKKQSSCKYYQQKPSAEKKNDQ